MTRRVKRSRILAVAAALAAFFLVKPHLAALGSAGTGDLARASTFVVLALLGVALYLLPSAIAALRHHRDRTAVLALNVLAGWTAIGWLVALVWSLLAGEARRAEA